MGEGAGMTDREQIEALYRDMYAAMVRKDRAALLRMHDESFVLVHMTGMRQDRDAYIGSILDGTLNYFSEQTESLDVSVRGDAATMLGRSRVEAAVFGGGRRTWRLALRFDLRKAGGEWKLTRAQASAF